LGGFRHNKPESLQRFDNLIHGRFIVGIIQSRLQESRSSLRLGNPLRRILLESAHVASFPFVVDRLNAILPAFGIDHNPASADIAQYLPLLFGNHMAPALKELVLVGVEDIGYVQPMSTHAVLSPL
jgi:hypothetical protein